MTIAPIERRLQTPRVTVPTKASPEVVQFASQMLGAHMQLLEQHNRQGDLINQALRGGLSAGNSKGRVVFKDVTFMTPGVPPWQAMALTNSWANQSGYALAGYIVGPGGQVWSRGVVKGGTTGSALFTLQALAPDPASNSIVSFGAGLDGAAELRIDNFGIFSALFSGTPKVSLAATWLSAMGTPPTTFPAPWPIFVDHGLPQATGCQVLACVIAATKQPGPIPQLIWEDGGNGRLRLDGAWGLQWNTRYTVTLRISAEA